MWNNFPKNLHLRGCCCIFVYVFMLQICSVCSAFVCLIGTFVYLLRALSCPKLLWGALIILCYCWSNPQNLTIPTSSQGFWECIAQGCQAAWLLQTGFDLVLPVPGQELWAGRQQQQPPGSSPTCCSNIAPTIRGSGRTIRVKKSTGRHPSTCSTGHSYINSVFIG